MDYKYSLNKYYITSFLCKRKTFHSSLSTLAHSWANIYYGQCKEILLSTSITLGTKHNSNTTQDVRLNLMRHSKGRTQKTAAFNCFSRALTMTMVDKTKLLFPFCINVFKMYHHSVVKLIIQ